MQIQIELFGMLRERMKERFPGGRGTVEVPDGATVQQAAEHLGIPELAGCVVMVDGQAQRDRGVPLSPGAKLTLIPPVAGG